MIVSNRSFNQGKSLGQEILIIAYRSRDIQIGFTFNYTTIADGNRNTTVWDIQTIQITQGNQSSILSFV